MKFFKTAVILSILLILIFVGAQFSWLTYTSTISKDLFSSASSEKTVVDFKELETLPKPVVKYFNLVLKDKSEIINKLYLSQNGGFRMDDKSNKYSKTEAQQFLSTKPRGFTWHAKIFIDAGVYVNVFDSYVDAKGAIKAKFLSLYTIVDEHNKKELSNGALQRYLAEAIWYPTALLPSQGVKWRAVDANKAIATLNDGNNSASLEFTFNDKGEVTSIYSPNRYREVEGKYIATPWLCEVSDYIDKNGYLIPKHGEVSWLIDAKKFTYFKLDIKDVKYN
ncbi:MAG: hypothetical protein OQK11_01095 [Thiovulaceae bacterium]|nr:hypothetical protein [Sulfurimonadaceae bacterium]